jgi:ketosteroid isomerase-like protein
MHLRYKIKSLTTEGETVVKNCRIAGVLVAVLAGLIGGWVVAAPADEQQEISNLERKVAVNGDPDEAIKYFEGGDDIVLFDIMGPSPEFVGQKTIHNHMHDSWGAKDVKAEFLELKVISDGKLALASSVQHATGKGPDGKPFDMTWRVTDVWRKTNGQWKLIHTHASVPIDMKTGKAEMASKM